MGCQDPLFFFEKGKMCSPHFSCQGFDYLVPVFTQQSQLFLIQIFSSLMSFEGRSQDANKIHLEARRTEPGILSGMKP